MAKKIKNNLNNPEEAALIRAESELSWWRGLKFGFCDNLCDLTARGAYVWGTNVVPDVPCPDEKVLRAWSRL